MTIWFDMDGTCADLYGVENWLDYLIAEDATPYKVAETIGNMMEICELLKHLQAKGYKIGVISWLSKNSSRGYDSKVRSAKYSWLKTNMKVDFDTIHIVKYGTPKQKYKDIDDILFDDEEKNRTEWGKNSYPPTAIIEVLNRLL